jgi:AcrR family transcriptional regulator
MLASLVKNRKAQVKPSKEELIVAAARHLFLEEGYGATSMEAIALKAGVSKPTLYSHFENKEGLFSEVMVRMCREIGGTPIDELSIQQTPAQVLQQAAKFMLKRALHPTGMALLRTVLAESQKFPELGQVFWETGPHCFSQILATYLSELKTKKNIKIADPQKAAEDFPAVLIGTYVLPVLMGVAPVPSDSELKRRITHTVTTFLAGISSKKN